MDGPRIYILCLIALLCVITGACGQSTKTKIDAASHVDASTSAIHAEIDPTINTEIKAAVTAALVDSKQTTSAPADQHGLINFNWTSIAAGVGTVAAGGGLLLYVFFIIRSIVDARSQIRNKEIDDDQEKRQTASNDQTIAAFKEIAIALINSREGQR